MIETFHTKDGNCLNLIAEDTRITPLVKKHGRLDYDLNTLPFIRRYIKPGMVVLDCGANIGSHTSSYLEWVGASGKVYAFEPNRQVFECLYYNCPSSVLFNAAVTNNDGFCSMVVDPSDPARGYVENKRGLINTMKIDSLNVSRVDFIKIDIEGCEIFALEGAAETIQRYRPVMCIEVNDRALGRFGLNRYDLIAKVVGMGYYYRPIWENAPMSNGKPDIICIPKEKWSPNL